MKKLTLVLSMMIALVGLNANAAMYIVGNGPFNNWQPGNGVEMNNNGDGTYSYTVAIDGAVSFVFADGLSSNWGTFNSDYRYGPSNGDMNINPNEWIATEKAGDHGAYKLIGDGTDYTFIFDEYNYKFRVEGNNVNITYETLTVAGSNTDLFGTLWDPTNTANDMTLVDGIYTWEKNEVILNPGGFEFKVVADHDVNYTLAWPGSNFYQPIENRGLYNLKITFDPVEERVNCDADLLELVPIDTTYTVVGPEFIFGSNWDANDPSNKMVKDEDGIYTLIKENVAIYGDFGFKIAGNYDSFEYPVGYNRVVILPEGEGMYTIRIYFNPEAGEPFMLNHLLTKTGEAPAIDHIYTVAGSEILFGSDWDETDATNDMVKGDDGIYTWTKEVTFTEPATPEFKVVLNHSWNYSWPVYNYKINDVTEAGTYKFVITFNPAGGEYDKINVTVTNLSAGMRGDVDGNQEVGIADVSALIDYLLSGDASAINLQNANCNLDGEVGIADVSALIDYLLSGAWND